MVVWTCRHIHQHNLSIYHIPDVGSVIGVRWCIVLAFYFLKCWPLVNRTAQIIPWQLTDFFFILCEGNPNKKATTSPETRENLTQSSTQPRGIDITNQFMSPFSPQQHGNMGNIGSLRLTHNRHHPCMVYLAKSPQSRVPSCRGMFSQGHVSKQSDMFSQGW